jgi:small subunit ribosomal protein S18
MKKSCLYCQKEKEPSFKEYDSLRKYLTQRGKIMSRERSGLCAKHQRRLGLEIKKARVLAFLPYVVYES